ncbi:hypothetical protein OH77DRAFT_1405729 [Trametes cingulata]|nr:hypothetical protein OH77DRAFT_1405729 [Trametes cingulata]
MYRLCGLIYFGKFHFTCRVVTGSGKVHLHDGMKTGKKLVPEGNLINMDSKMLGKLGKRKLSVLVYQKM